MQTGQLNKQITIQQFEVTELESGQEVKEWTDLITLFANIDYKKGSERFEGKNVSGQLVATQKMVVTIYNRVATFNEQNRIMFENNLYAIVSITPIDNDFYLELEVKKRDNNNIQ
jgi:SPP1 family predicted phage head-tail adaptor